MEKPNQSTTKKTLFVCRHGIARSQWGAEFWNLRFPGSAVAAGTDVRTRGKLVRDWKDPEKNKFIWLALEGGIEIAQNQRRPLDEETMRGIGRAIVFDLKAVDELEKRRGQPLPWPAERFDWDIPDPHHLSKEDSASIREIIRCRVGELATSAAVIGGAGPSTADNVYYSPA